jgi:hypothetical protein
MCGYRGLRKTVRVGEGLMGTWQLGLSTGLVRREVCIVAQQVTTPSKGFFLF